MHLSVSVLRLREYSSLNVQRLKGLLKITAAQMYHINIRCSTYVLLCGS